MAVNSNSELWPVMPPQLQEIDATLTEELNALPVIKPDLFTPRGLQVIQYALADSTMQQTATQLRLSARTVENHRTSLLKRVQAKGLDELVNLCCHSEVVVPPYERDTSPLLGELTPEGGLFLKCTALGIKGEAVKQKLGWQFSGRKVMKPTKAAIGALGVPRMVLRCYWRGLFIPQSQLPADEDGEVQSGSV